MKKLTDGAKEFLNKVIPNYIVYSRKSGKAYCMECGTEFDVKELGKTKPNLECNCPKCGAKSVLKVNSKTRCWCTEHGIGIIPATDYAGNLVIRYFDVYREYPTHDFHRHIIKTRECLRDIFANGKWYAEDRTREDNDFRQCRKYENPYYYGYYSKTRPGDYALHVNLNCEIVRVYEPGLSNLKVIAPNVPYREVYKYLPYKNDWQNLQIFVRNLMEESYRSVLEYTWKVGLKGLAREFAKWDFNMDEKEKSLIKILKLNKEQYHKLLKLGSKATKEDLKWFQYATKYNVPDEDGLDIYRKYLSKYHEYTIDEFFKEFPYRIHKFGRYMETQGEIDLTMYLDYLRMCKQLELDLKNSAVCFPKNIKASHDMVADTINEIEFSNRLKGYADDANERKTEYEKTVDTNSVYRYENELFEIRVPKTTMEIGIEGYELRHCVAMYVPDIIAGKKVVLFLRKKSEPDVPFYTVEIMDGMVSQCKGYSNRPRIPEVESFIREFAKKFKLRMNDKEFFKAIA